MARRAVCRAGLHSMADPANVAVRIRPGGREVRECKECRRVSQRTLRAVKRAARIGQTWQLEWTGPHRRSTSSKAARRRAVGNSRSSGRLQYQIAPGESDVLQLLADGLTLDEIAEQLVLDTSTVCLRLRNVRQKYGVATNAEAIAQALKRGAVRPDRVTARRLPKSHAVVHHAFLLRQFIQGAREPYGPSSRALQEELDVLMSWTEAHAVSVLWASGRMTSKHVPQTRNRYRGTAGWARVKKG